MAILRLTVLALMAVMSEARTNKGTVQQNIKKEWGYVIWGDHIDHDDYLRGMVAVASDFVCTGSCGFTYRYFEDLVEKQIESFTSGESWKKVGMSFVMQLARDPGTIRDIVAGNAFIKGTVGVASCNHWTDECRFCKPCTFCSPRFNCNDCGTYRVPRANTHQPYFAFTVRAQSKEYKFSLTNACNKEVSVALRYLPTGASWTTLCWYAIPPGQSITPSDHSGNTLRTTNSVWYYYAETRDRSFFWRGSDNTRTCLGRSLGMRKMSSVSGSRLKLRLTCNNRRMSEIDHMENQTQMEAETPDQQLCLLAEDGLEGAEDREVNKDVLAFPNHDEEEGVGAALCADTKDVADVAFSLEGLSQMNLPANETGVVGAVGTEDEVVLAPSCDETCAAIEESYQELQKKLEKIHGSHGRRLHLV